MVRQIDILLHAQDYLAQLRLSRDPLSGSKLPASSAALESDLQKLFFFSGKNLGYMIAYDDVAERPAFFVTPEQGKRLVPQNGPIDTKTLSEYITRAVSVKQCRGLSRYTLYAWLEEGGYLQRDDSNHYRPTALGRSIGITFDSERHYFEFDPNAQQFIIDRLQDLSRFSQAHSSPDQKRKVKIEDSEKLQANLQGMKLLSQGLHPYTDMPLAPQDPLNQERLRKCFDYVAWAMGRSLEAGYFTAKGPFSLPQERWKDIAIGQEPTTFTQFCQMIGKLLPDPTAVQAPTSRLIQAYLLSCGLLREVPGKRGYMRYLPTSAGNALGFVETEKANRTGQAYTTVLCNAEAQQYLVDHLGELISFAARK